MHSAPGFAIDGGHMLDRRHALAGGLIAATGGADWLIHAAAYDARPRETSPRYVALRKRATDLFSAAFRHYWTDSHIVPTDGGGIGNGIANPALATPSIWQSESFANVLFHDATVFGSAASSARLRAQ